MDLMSFPAIQQLGLTLLHFVWQGTVIGALFALLMLVTRRARAQWRYDLAVLTLIALAAAPVVTFLYLLNQPVVTVPAGSSGVETLVLTFEQSASAAVAGSLLHWVVGGWLVGVLVMSFRLFLGWRYLAGLRRSADWTMAAHLQPMLQHLGKRLRVFRQVQLAVSERIASPVVIGWLKPLILLPPAVVTGLPARQLEMVLAHELAHIRRYDHFVNLFQAVVETVLFYHPVVLWVSRRIRIERENACDDLAVQVTDNRLAYVEMLATLERLRQPAPRLVLAINDGQVISRIRRLVEQGRSDRQYGLTAPGILAVTVLATAVGISLAPEPTHDDNGPVAEWSAATVAGAQGPLPHATEPDIEPLSPNPIAREDLLARAGGSSPDVTAEPVRPEAVEPAPEPDRTPTESGPRSEPATEPENVASPDAGAPVGPKPMIASAQELPGQPEVQPMPSSSQTAAESPAPGSDPTPAKDTLLALASIPERHVEPARPEVPVRTVPEPEPLSGGEVISRIAPEYPVRARQRRTGGLVEVEFLVDERGRVAEIEVLREQPRGMDFATAATRAVQQWEFEPYRRGDEAVSRRLRLEIDFDLADVEDCRETLGTRIPRC